MKCNCRLDIVVLEVGDGCPVHKEVSGLQLERENILSALGEHPDSTVDIAQRVSDIRDEGRAYFHALTRATEQLIDLTRQIKVFEERDVHWQNLLVNCQANLQDLLRAVRALKAASADVSGPEPVKSQPMALNCTKCGSTIHTDSFHSERCPGGYR